MQNDCSTRALQTEEVDPQITRLPFLVALAELQLYDLWIGLQ